MSESLRVVVQGALGKMGREIVGAMCRDSQLSVVGTVDKEATDELLQLPDGAGNIPISSNLDSILDKCHPDVMVDFTRAEATMMALDIAARYKVHLVIGTTGLTSEDLAKIDSVTKANELGAIVSPNFALGAVLMIHLAKTAAKFLDWAEIIEMHHEQKVDSPSGTALSTAKAMLQSRGKPFSRPPSPQEVLPNSRGGELEGIAIHSVRLPGLVAHQEVIFGAPGQTLSIRHDTINRECFMPGVLLATKKVPELRGLTYGLDALLELP